MKPASRISVAAILVVSALIASASAGEAMTADQAFALLKTYDYAQPRAPLSFLELHVAKATADPQRARQVADRLCTLLADPTTTLAARRFICKQLLLVGSDAQVPTLVKMLGDPKTADMARRTLEGIPGDASLQALRDALPKLKGKALIGVINSLGVRRDAQSVPTLAKWVSHRDKRVAAAALQAIGKIATKGAASALLDARPAPDQLALLHDAQLTCAQRLAAAGDANTAESVCRHILAANPPPKWRFGALAGLVAVRKQAALPDVLAAIASEDAQVRGHALQLTHQMPGKQVTAALVHLLARLAPGRQVALLDVLAERGDRSAVATIAKLLDAKDERVRGAAIGALGRLGDASSVERLARLAATGSGAARQSLVRLTGADVEARLLAAAGAGDPPVRIECIRAIAARRTAGATPALLKAAADADANVRRAALAALAVVGDPACYPKLIDVLAAAPTQTDARAAERAVAAVGGRVASAPECVVPLLTALRKAPPTIKPALLRLLSTFGGTQALQAVRSHTESPDAQVSTAAVRALANWPDASPAPDLLRLAEASKERTHRVLALRGYLRMAQKASDEAARLKMLEHVRPIAKTTEAKRMLLAALMDVASPGALHVAAAMLDDKDVHGEAALAMLKIANALLRTDRAAIHEPMKKLMQSTKDPKVARQAKALYAESLKSPATPGQRAAALRHNTKRSVTAKAALARRAPKGHHLACYLDCGPDMQDGARGRPTLRALTGTPYVWAKGAATADQLRFLTIAFTGQQVVFEATGLNPRKAYRLGFSWWDYDHNTRAQSVWASAGKPGRLVKLLGKTRLPSGHTQPPAEHTVPLPRELSAHGAVRLLFRNEATPNCVVSEVWLWESEAESEVKMPPPRKKGGTPVVLLTGIDYPGHKWRQTAPVLADLLLADPRLDVDVVEDWAAFLASPKLHDYKVCILHLMNWKTPDPPAKSLDNLRAFVANGGGLVLTHFACGAFQKWPEFVNIAGRVWNPKLRGHDPHGAFRVEIADPDHPITKGLKAFDTTDELYTCLDGQPPIRVLARARSKVDGKLYPIAFVLTYGKGRVFHSVLGHDVRAYAAPAVGELCRRATAWAAGLPPVPTETPVHK